MTDTAGFPDGTDTKTMAPSSRSARVAVETATSLGIGSLRQPSVPAASAASLDVEDVPVVEGSVIEGADEIPGAEEIQGVRGPSGVQEVSVPDQPGRILAIEEFGPTVRVFRIGRASGFTFRPGQYVKLGAAGGKLEDFSLASAPHDPYLEVAIELRPGGKVTPALFGLRVGDAVELSNAAKGSLALDEGAAHHLMIATVTGIAPLRSMVLDALHRGTTATFTMVLGASYAAELPFHAELEALAARESQLTYVPTVSRPDEPANRGWTGARGRADVVARVLADRFDAASSHVYAVGNAGMIQSVARDLGRAGFSISTESYGG